MKELVIVNDIKSGLYKVMDEDGNLVIVFGSFENAKKFVEENLEVLKN